MRSFDWPGEDGWPYSDVDPYPDAGRPVADPDGWIDDDAIVLRCTPLHLESLEPLERQVIVAHYGIDGTQPRTMKELHHELDMPRAQLRDALAEGLAKLRLAFGD